MGRSIEGNQSGTPSTGQAYGLLAAWLADRGRLTMPQAARLCANLMLGDWNRLAKSQRAYYMEKAHRALVNLSAVLPIYNLAWKASGQRMRTIRVWYYCGKEPARRLRYDLARAGCHSD